MIVMIVMIMMMIVLFSALSRLGRRTADGLILADGEADDDR